MMACCGRPIGGAPDGMRRSGVLFEYRGPGHLTIFGRATGRRYHFPSAGARVQVDARDAEVLRVIGGLEIVADDPPLT